ncbi:L-ornithine N(5)-monooxygenase [Pseudozyma hubeiensis]|nr:L-ornithine N(5)-monooxygenase [Pseudozyma hubeiensis]
MTRTDTEFEAVVIGAGPSGIAAACELKRRIGLTNIKIFERGAKFGGTWFHNRYPGAACDVPPRLYSFSFYQKKNWKDFMARQPEMESYLQEAAQAFGLDKNATFNADVYSAEWIEEKTHWRIKYRSVDGDEHGVVTARVVVNGSGALSVPRDCDVDGWQSFKGPLFHSAKWDTSVDLTGKDVVVLGNGCSATQIVPSIAKRVKSVTQVVRAKHWYAPTPENPFGNPIFRWLERHIPGFVGLERTIFTLFLDIHFIQAWNKEGKGARDRFAKNSTLYVSTVAPERYHHLLMPTQEELKVACKRRVFDDAYIPCLNRDNVELTKDQAVKITENEVILQSGRRLKADVIILASGFKTGDTAVQMRVTGRNGKELNEVWKKGGAPQAYRSTICHNFPNLALMWGPNTATGHFSAIFSIESSVRFMCTIFKPIFLAGPKHLSLLERSAGHAVDVKPEAQDKEDAMIRHQMDGLIYTSGCKGWYTNSNGRVSTLYPGFQLTFARRSDYPVATDLTYTGLPPFTRPSAYWTYLQQIASFLRIGDVPEYRPAYLRKRLWIVRYLLDPLFMGVYNVSIQLLLVLVWIADKGLFYTRGAKDFEKVKQQYLVSE